MSTDAVRKSTLATLSEITATEAALKTQGIDVRDEDEWMELRDIVARIERKLATGLKEATP